MAEYWELRFDIRQDFCYCCCCEKGTRRKSSNLDLTISCLHLKIYKQYELRRYLICQLPVLRTLYPFGKKPKYLECMSFSVTIAFKLDIGVEKEPKRPELSGSIEKRLKKKKLPNQNKREL